MSSDSRFIAALVTLILAVAAGFATASPASAQTVEGDLIYYTGPATIDTDLSGNDVIVGRQPDGDGTNKGDTTLGTTDATKFTVTVADGAVLTYNNDLTVDGYFALSVFGRNTLDVTGGSIAYLYGFGDSTVAIAGGDLHFTYGFNANTTNITGGSVDMALARNTSVFNIAGGSVTDILGESSAVFNVTGGTLGTNTVRIKDNAILNLFGSGLGLTANGSGADSFGAYAQYRLSGTLQNGPSVDGVRFRDYGGGFEIGGGQNASPLYFNGIAALVSPAPAPEPSSLALVALVTLVTLVTVALGPLLRAARGRARA